MKLPPLLHVFYIIITCLFTKSLSFEFKAVDVTPDLPYVSSRTSYTINVYRSSTQLLDSTAWNTEAVPAGATVIVVFPSQYTLVSPSCNSVAITIADGSIISPSGFGCTVAGRQLTISNLFASSTFVKSLVIKLDNIINPSLAITTDNFIVKIGNDISSDSPMASIIISPTKLNLVNATFENKTVNSTSNLVVTFVSGNLIKSGSNIVIEFPATLQWTRDISSSHPLPLSSVLTCTGLSGNVRSSISCVGSLVDRAVTLSNINSADIGINQTVSFKVGQLFAPPSTEEIDQIGIKIRSLYTDGFYYDMDSDKTKITGLTARTMTVAFSSTSRVTVNARIAIQMDIVLADTINQADTMRVFFPSVSSFLLTDVRSNTIGFLINSTQSSYDSTNRILDIRQRSQVLVNFAGKSISIQMSNFTVPPSIKQFGITFQVLRQNFVMAQGVVNTNALTTAYTGSVSANELGINKVARYDIVVDVKDNHTGLMIIQIVLPITLTASVSTFSARTSLSATVIPSFSLSGTSQTTITLTNLITPSNTTILPQNITITLNNITNPSSVKSIGSFIVRTYYTADLQERVSQSTISTTLVTVNGLIAENSVRVVPSSVINYELTSYTVKFIIENPVDVNGFFSVNLPSEIDISQMSSVRMSTSSITSQLIPFALTNSTSIRLTNNISRITSNTQVTFVLANIRNPSSTKPTSFPQVRIQSFNSLLQTIDILNANNSISVQTMTANALNNAKLDRNSLKNDQVTLWKVNLTQTQTIESGETVIFVIDNAAILPSVLTCIDTITSINLTCTKLGSKPSVLSSFSAAKAQFSYISVSIPSSYISRTTFLFTIQSIQNPASYLPFSTLLFTVSSDLTYLYSTIEQSYQNSQLSAIGINTYSFSKRQLKESSVLSFNYTVPSRFGSMIVDFDVNGFGLASVFCSSVQWTDVTCTVINNTLKLFSSLSSLSPKTVTITISNLVTPSTQNTAPLYVKFSTFDLTNQPMGTNFNSLSYSLQCQFPCKTCSTNTSQCLSCYRSPLSLKQYLGIDKKCYQQCPDGFIQNVDLYACEACSAPCMHCNNLKTNCTKCNTTSEFIYLSYTALSDTSTCVKTCPSRSFPDTNSVPVFCQPCTSPCLECKSSTFCLSCLQSNPLQTLYLYNGTCIRSCPADVTVINSVDNTCIACSPECKTCAVITTNCTTCADTSIFYDGKCLTSCPLPLIKYNSTCVPCNSKCQNCSITPTNCTSCVKTSNLSFFYSNDCLSQCPTFYYPNINKTCLECDKLGIGCKNCQNQTSCKSCDSGYVLVVDKCLTTVPIGYINNSGVAVPCAGDCKTCEGTVNNCTSCKTLNLNGNLCQATCNIGETGVSQVCTRCQYPCQTCSGQVYLCQSCYSNSSTFLYNSQCLATCPDKFYKNTLNMSCSACKQPCQKCVDETTCVTCVTGFFFFTNTSQCLSVCPNGMLGQNKLCVDCQSPCSTCTRTKTTCQSCIVGYFYSPSTNECLGQCPSGTIKNQTLRICESCASPCQTCANETTQCLTCIRGQYFMQNQCYTQCPEYYFANGTKCSSCVLPCMTCTSETLCTTCSGTLYLHRQGCVAECPSEYGRIIDGKCTQCDSGCFSCQSSGTCLQCSSGYIFYLDQCITSCPTGYTSSKVNNTLTCIVKQQAQTKLESTLSSTSSMSFPLPFTIFGLIIIGAGLMSKLQNSNTYFIGLAYSVFGILETCVVLYFLYYYFFKYSNYEMLTVYLILAGLGVFALLNIFGFIAHTIQLCTDSSFHKWMKSGCSPCVGVFIATLLSLTVNYKFKLVLFSKIFNFNVFKAQLTSVQKFKIFNFFSFLGILGQVELICALFRQLYAKSDFGYELKMTFIDALVVLSLNVVFSIASSWKSDDFFTEQIDGVVINKKVFIEGDVINKQALKDYEEYHPYFSTRKTFNESRQVLKNVSDVINEFNDEYSMSISQEKKTSKNSKNIKTQDKLYFQDEDLSSQTLRYKNDLEANPSKKSQLNNNRQSVFDKEIQEEEQTDKNYNDRQLRDEGFLISSHTEDIENRSLKKSQNIFCESPRKRQKIENPDLSEKKGHYSQEQEQQKAKKLRLNKEIQDSASHYNKVMKDKELRQPGKQQTKMKRSSKSRKSRKDNKQPTNSVPSYHDNNHQVENPSSKKLILQNDGLESSHDSQYKQQEAKNPRYRFQQVSNSLKVSSEISNALLEEQELADPQNRMRKMKITSQNSSKTYALPIHLSPMNKQSGVVDSESETVCQDGRLKPERRQNSIKELGLQNKIKINTMHYNGEENSVFEEDAPKSRTRKPRYERDTNEQVKYDKIQAQAQSQKVVQQEEKIPSFPVLIQKNQLAESQQSYSIQQIEKNPLGYSPQSRIMQNKQDSRDFSQDDMLLQLHSHLKTDGLNLQQGKILELNQARHEHLETILQGRATQTPYETADKDASDPSNTKETNNLNNNMHLKEKYDKIMNKVESMKSNRRVSKKRNLHLSGDEPVASKKHSDIYISPYLQDTQVPIKKREQRAERERKHPIQHRRSKDKFTNNHEISGAQGNTESQFQLSPSKASPNRHIFIENGNLLSPVYRSKPADVIVSSNSEQHYQTKNKSPGKYHPVYQSSNIEFDPAHERINTNTIFGDDLKDQLDNLSMKQINFGKNSQYVPTNYANEHLSVPSGVNLQDYPMYRFNHLISTQLVPRPNIQRFTSPINESPTHKHQNDLQNNPAFSITNSKSLASYYGYNKITRQGDKSRQRQKAIVRSKSRDGTNYAKATLNNRSPQKETQRMHSSGKEGKNEISSNRLKEIEKIYLQRLH